MNIFSVILFIVCTMLVTVLLKNANKEYGILLSLGVSVTVILICVSNLTPVFDEISQIADKSGINSEYILALLKALGICYISEFASEACKDAGEFSLSAKAELCGKTAMIIIAFPLVKEILDISISMLEV